MLLGLHFLEKVVGLTRFLFSFSFVLRSKDPVVACLLGPFLPTTDWTCQVRSSEALFLGNTTPDVSFSLPGHRKSVRFVSSGCHQKQSLEVTSTSPHFGIPPFGPKGRTKQCILGPDEEHDGVMWTSHKVAIKNHGEKEVG